MSARAELFRLAQSAGHTDLALFPTKSGRRFFVTCSCGYKSTTRRTEVDALGAAVHHALKAGQEARQNGGVSLARNVSAAC